MFRWGRRWLTSWRHASARRPGRRGAPPVTLTGDTPPVQFVAISTTGREIPVDLSPPHDDAMRRLARGLYVVPELLLPGRPIASGWWRW